MKVLKETIFRLQDRHGYGHFGASRGDRVHIGVDLRAEPGEYVFSPFQGEITKYGWAYSGSAFRYIEITGVEYKCRIFYAQLDPAHYVGKEINELQFIGVVQNIAARYPGITPHIHFELYDKNDVNRENPLDPTELLKKKV